MDLARAIAALLVRRAETLAVAESSAGGLINAGLVAVPGASAWYLGGAIIYTAAARTALLGLSREDISGMRSATEPMARLLARRVREKLAATWGLAETGATGPAGNRYGDPAGHACIAVSGPIERVVTLETGRTEREENMRAFSQRALELLEACLSAAP
jgi:PncC family amidohydrolase